MNFIFSNFNHYNSISQNSKMCQFNSIVCPTLTQIPYSPLKLKRTYLPLLKMIRGKVINSKSTIKMCKTYQQKQNKKCFGTFFTFIYM